MDSTDITITGNTASWTLPPTDGEILGTYTGTFHFKCYLTPLAQLEAGREYRALLGNLSTQASDTEGNLSFALVQLKHRIVKAPPFWTATLQDSAYAGNVPDLNIIALVLDRAIYAETLFKEKIAKEREDILNRAIQVGEKLAQKDNELEEG
jgi:hypothetical protein